MLTPGAAMGLFSLVLVLENEALFKFSSTADTVITPGILAGEYLLASSLLFPAATTTMAPSLWAYLMASSYDVMTYFHFFWQL